MADLENVGRRGTQRTENPRLGKRSGIAWLRNEHWLTVLIILIVLGIWEFLAGFGYISALFFPPPSKILTSLYLMFARGSIYPNLKASLIRLFAGFCLGCIPGLLIGWAMGWSPRLGEIVDPIVAALHPLPKIAMFPLIMIIFGIGEISKVVAVSIAVFFPMIINSMAGVRQINPLLFEVSQNYGANLFKTFARVVVPGSLPMVLAGARIAINLAMVITIAVEIVSANQGLGVMIWFAWQTLRVEELYACLIITGLLGIMINFSIQKLTLLIIPWYHPKTVEEY